MSSAATLMAAMRSAVRYLPHLYLGSQTAMGNQRSNVVGAVGIGRDLFDVLAVAVTGIAPFAVVLEMFVEA